MRHPALRGLSAVILTAAAVGILQGYAALGRRTVERYQMEDFGLFYASARQFVQHGHLYGPLIRPGAVRASDARNLNPPHVNLLFLPFALLSPKAALIGWCLLNLCALGDVLRIGARELGWHVVSLRALCGALFLLAWAPTAALVITVQLALLVAWVVTRAWRAARHGQWSRAGIWIGLAASAKLFLLVFLPYLLLRSQKRAFWNALLAMALAAAAGALVFSPGAYRAWGAQFGEVTWYGHYMNASLWGLLARTLDDFRVYQPATIAPALVQPIWSAGSGLLLLVTWWRTRREAVTVDTAFAVLLAAALLTSPLGWVYYVWVAVVPAAAVLRGTRAAATPVDIVAWVLVAAGLLWHASATIWFQPSPVATFTVSSPYFWSLAVAWTWGLVRLTPGSRPDRDAALSPTG